MNIDEKKKALAELQHKLSAYNHAMTLLYYDADTGAPKETADNMASTMSVLSEASYLLSTGPETRELLAALEASAAELTAEENREVYLLSKDLKELSKLPMDEYLAYQELLVKADAVWHRAKEESNFEMFRPLLEEIFETNKRFAGYVAPEKNSYDYWLGRYEEGLDRNACDKFFGAVRDHVVPLLGRIAGKPQVDDSFIYMSVPLDKQRILSDRLMELMGLDRGHVGISETEHPFTTSLGSHLDERITTHYFEKIFTSSMYSVIHEGGHALYDTGSRREYAFTVLDGGVSMGIHESQSRFYENIIGRSRAFLEYIHPMLQELIPELREHTAEELYKAVNKAQPSLIRTEADEITYSLHVMVRYELEKAVMAGDLKVADLPGAWNELYKKYLGVTVPNDKQGVLQDSHWCGGCIGYFPSYALGSAYGAQFLNRMEETVDVYGNIASGNFAAVNDWNREHIWQYGRLYPSDELLRRVVGEFDPKYYTDYLEAKAKDVYEL